MVKKIENPKTSQRKGLTITITHDGPRVSDETKAKIKKSQQAKARMLALSAHKPFGC